MANEREGFDINDPFDVGIVNRYYFPFSNVYARQLELRYDQTIEGESLEKLRRDNETCIEFHSGAAIVEAGVGIAMLLGSRGKSLKAKIPMILGGAYLLSEAGKNALKAISRAEIQEVLDSNDSVGKDDFVTLKWSKFP